MLAAARILAPLLSCDVRRQRSEPLRCRYALDGVLGDISWW
jgi:hypothetical protein